MASIKNAKKILSTFKENGFEAYIVGGAVRDYIMGVESYDIDITTNARPRDTMRIFDKVLTTGIKYGTVTILHNEDKYEITTFRTDGPSEDNRHPDYIYYGNSIEEDVFRRDFTINGLLMNEEGKIIDFVEGKIDIEKNIIRTIGEPTKRFNEDALRMIRAFYLRSKLNFKIEKNTLISIKENKKLLDNISKERLFNELIKILKGNYNMNALIDLKDNNIQKHLPGFNKPIEILIRKNIKFKTDTVFTLGYFYNQSEMEYWPISNKHKNKYVKASNRAKSKRKIDKFDLYELGLEIAILAARIMNIVYDIEFSKSKLKSKYNKLEIKSILDLKIKPREMMALKHKKAGAWIKEIQKEFVIKILKGDLENSKESLFREYRENYL
jgi:tRNA nucleotidyltransferase (CCA-adding enzyme)